MTSRIEQVVKGGRERKRREERGAQEDQEHTREARECVTKMAELYRNHKLGEGKQRPDPGLERFRVGGWVSSSGRSQRY